MRRPGAIQLIQMLSFEVIAMTDIELYRQFLKIKPSDLPAAPFQLTEAIAVVNKEKFLRVLRTEVEASIAFLEKRNPSPHPRHTSGALRAEVDRVLSFTVSTFVEIQPLAA